jgi:hypothetical protein
VGSGGVWEREKVGEIGERRGVWREWGVEGYVGESGERRSEGEREGWREFGVEGCGNREEVGESGGGIEGEQF